MDTRQQFENHQQTWIRDAISPDVGEGNGRVKTTITKRSDTMKAQSETTGSIPATREAYQGLVRRQSTKVLDLQTLHLEEEQRAAKARVGQQLYAKIKRTSKYYGQGEKGALFEVFVEAGNPAAYLVQGGPGGQYRLADVNLYVKGDDGRELKIS